MNYAYGVMGTNFKINIKKTHKKAYLFVSFFIILSVIAVVIGYIYRAQLMSTITGSSSVEPDTGVSRERLGVEKIETSIARAQAQADAGDTAAAVDSIDATIKQTASEDEKAVLYLQKSTIIASTGDTPAAIEAAAAAAESQPSVEHYDYLAQLYEKNGDTENARKAYEGALREFDKLATAEQEGQVTRFYYVDKINGYGGSAS